MKKSGFTLLELLAVLVIITTVGTSSMLAFNNINEETSKKDSENVYKDIQRSAILYIDLNDEYLNHFITSGYVDIPLRKLVETNYFSGVEKTEENGEITKKVINSSTNEEISQDSYVRVYIAKKDSFEYQNACMLIGSDEATKCVADSNGSDGNEINNNKDNNTAEKRIKACCTDYDN